MSIPLKSSPNNKFLTWLESRLGTVEVSYKAINNQVNTNTKDIEELKKGGGGGGGTITIDTDLNTKSENAVENKAIALEFEKLAGAVQDLSTDISNIPVITIDNEFSDSSANPVQNSVVSVAMNSLTERVKALEDSDPATITIDDSLSDSSVNPVQNKVINFKVTEINNTLGTYDTRIKNLENSNPDTITIDDELSETSENPVQNKVITSKVTHIEGDIDGLTERVDNINVDDIKNSVEQIETELTGYDKRITDLEGNSSEVVTGVAFTNSKTYKDVPVSTFDGADTNEVESILDGKCIPISIYPMDTTATWRYYHLSSWVYDVENKQTKVHMIATDTSSNVNIVTLPILESDSTSTDEQSIEES